MAGDPELDRGQISEYLQASLALQDLEAELSPLIEHGHLRRYEAGHSFRERGGARPLRILLEGRIESQRRSPRPRHFGPGSLFGLEGVAAWASKAVPGRLRGLRPSGGEVKERALVLEIAVADFDAAIGRTGRLRERLVAAAQVEERASDIVEALEVQQCIGNAQTDTLYDLLARGQIVRYEHGEELLAEGHAPDAYFVVLEGLVELIVPEETSRRSLMEIGLSYVQQQLRGDAERIQDAAKGAADLGGGPLTSLGLDVARRINHLLHLRVPATSVAPGAVVGLQELIGQTTMATSARAWGTALVARLSRSTFLDLQKIQPDFRRAVIRGRGPRAPRIPRLPQNIGLVIAHPELRFPELGDVKGGPPPGVLRGLVDLLAESAAVHLFDRVLVLHLVPAGSPGAGEEHWHDHQPPGFPESSVVVRHVRVPVAEEEEPAEAAERALKQNKEPAELVLIEAFALEGRSDAVLSFAHFTRPFSIVHLMDSPSALPPLPLLRQARPTVPSAVLRGSPGAIGIGHVIYRITRDLRDRAERSLAERFAPPELRAAREAELARTQPSTGLAEPRGDRSAASALTELSDALMANLQSALELVEERLTTTWSRTEHLPPTWPLGAVRLRFSPELLAKIAAFEAPEGSSAARPLFFEDLGLGSEALGAARLVFDRWARAVTWRRVGLALGGGGPYGLVHVPLLKELRRARVPLDVVSGASVGSTVGAYFSVLGEEGLDQLVDQFLVQSLIIAPLAVLSSASVEALFAFQIGQIELAQLDVPFIPVVTNALLGTEWDVRHGRLALGVRASGSLPPLVGPTVMGSRRYLDGGIVANVPVNVLRDEQVALVIASNPISTASPHARTFPFLAVPFVGEFVRESRLFPRLGDLMRLIPMLFGTLGETQLADADVAYRPITGDEGRRIRPPIRLERDVSLQRTVNDAVTQWHRMLGNRPLLVCLSADRRFVELISGHILFIPGRDEIDPSCVLFLEDLARFLTEKPFIAEIGVRVTARSRDDAAARARAVQAALIAEGVSSERLRLEPAVSEDEGVSFPVRSLLEERSARQQIVTLSRVAVEQCRDGDVDLGRLLAIKAAEIAQREGERPLELDRALRTALGVPGRPLRGLESPGSCQVECLAWHPTGRWLALADDDGWVGVWDLQRDAAGPVWREHVHPGGTDPDVRAIAWSPDGHGLATCGNDGVIAVHELDFAGGGAPTVRRLLSEHAGTWEQWGVAYSPDGARLLVTRGNAATVGVLEIQGRSPVARETQFVVDVSAPAFFLDDEGGAPEQRLACSATVLAATFDEEGERVATAAADGSVVIWHAATGIALATLEPPGEPAHRLAWRGERLAVAAGAVARIHDTSSIRLGFGSEARKSALSLTLEGHDQSISALVFSPDGQRLLTASRDGSTRIWGAARGELRMVMRGEPTPVLGAAWHPAGDAVAARTELGETWIWDAWSGERLARLRQGGEIRAASFRPDGAQLATASSDGTVCLWDPFAHGVVQRQRRRASGHGRVQVVCTDWRPGDPAQVATAWVDGVVEIWHPETREVFHTLSEPAAPPDKAWVAWSPDGRWIATTRRSARRPSLFRADDGSPRELAGDHGLPEPGRRAEVFGIHWSPDGAYVAVNYVTGIAIWDVETGEKVAEHPFHDQGVQSLCWHPRERGRFALSIYSGWGSVLRGHVGGELAPCHGGGDFAWRVAHSPDGGRIAAAHNDGVARIYDAGTGEQLASLSSGSMYRGGQGDPVRVVAWSPDGARLAIGDSRERVGVFAVKAGEEPALEPMDQDESHRSAISRLTWLDAARLASASEDGTVRIWEQQDGVWTTTTLIEGYAMPVTWLAPDPERRRLITAADDGTCRVEILDPAMLVDALRALVGGRQLTDEEVRRLSAGRGYRGG